MYYIYDERWFERQEGGSLVSPWNAAAARERNPTEPSRAEFNRSASRSWSPRFGRRADGFIGVAEPARDGAEAGACDVVLSPGGGEAAILGVDADVIERSLLAPERIGTIAERNLLLRIRTRAFSMRTRALAMRMLASATRIQAFVVRKRTLAIRTRAGLTRVRPAETGVCHS